MGGRKKAHRRPTTTDKVARTGSKDTTTMSSGSESDNASNQTPMKRKSKNPKMMEAYAKLKHELLSQRNALGDIPTVDQLTKFGGTYNKLIRKYKSMLRKLNSDKTEKARFMNKHTRTVMSIKRKFLAKAKQAIKSSNTQRDEKKLLE